MHKRKNLYVAITLVALLLAGGLYYFLQEEAEPKATVADDALPSGITFNGSSIVEQQDGHKLWEVTAETITVDPATKNVMLTNIRAIFYQEDKTLEVTAPQGSIDANTRDIAMSGGIAAHTNDGASLDAGEVRYATTSHQLTANGTVMLARDDVSMKADSLSGDPVLVKVQLQGHACVKKGGSL